MTKTITIKNLKFEFSIFKKDEAVSLLKLKKEVERELKNQIIEKEREAQIRNYHWLN